ncbi:MAG: zinc ribbon domain-containing protein [Planctomycetes bacterium]|nr:zinc ribbon domain-containing protein [Planctomycetota bacterium]
MPTYEYECEACGATFERFQSITAAPVRRCPSCRRAKVRRLIGAGAGLLFKGSGFYVTDYRSAEYQAKAKAEAPTAPTAGKDAAAAAAPEKSAHKHAAKAGK